jgi:hypothetical protein
MSVIATGNWGCGAFNGNLELKFLVQLLAASSTGRDLHYFTFGDKEFAAKVQSLLTKLKEENISFSKWPVIVLIYYEFLDMLYTRLIQTAPKLHFDLFASVFERRSPSPFTGIGQPVADNTVSSTTNGESSVFQGAGRSLTNGNGTNNGGHKGDKDESKKRKVQQ